MEKFNNPLAGSHLTDEQIRNFQKIYKEKFNIILSNREALDY